jgi:hypothetical protein
MNHFDFVDKFVITAKYKLARACRKVLDPQLLESDRFSRFKSKIEYVRDVIPKE